MSNFDHFPSKIDKHRKVLEHGFQSDMGMSHTDPY